MKSSTFMRSLELAKLAAQVGLKELRSGDLKSRLEQAVLIANSLSNLKGAAMKAGQLLSLDLGHYFPPEAIEKLSQLQNAATAHSIEEIETILNRELSEDKRSQIKNLSPRPIGVASIGQVHRAEFHGQQIILKIQYPGVADSIDSDLKILKTLAVSFCQITGRKMNLEPLFDEFKGVLKQEVDYTTEAIFQKKYKESLGKLKSERGIVYVVPEIMSEISTNKILAMNYESGVSLRTWIQSNPSMNLRISLAHAILELYFHEFFEWGMVQTDPNWANFLVDESDSRLKLILLDFGATRTYEKTFIKNYIRLLHLAAEKKHSQLKEHAIEFGLIDQRESEAAFQAFYNLLSTAIKPFFVHESDSPHFDFSDKNHSLESQETAKALSNELIYSPPPYQIIFLHRKLAGVYSILKSLEVKLDISSYWQKMTELSADKD